MKKAGVDVSVSLPAVTKVSQVESIAEKLLGI